MKAIAAILNEPRASFVLETISIDAPRADEVRVRILAVGICHTDLVFASGAMGTSFPVVLGHEGAGIVESVGSSVTKVAPGDKVLLTFRSCGTCARCVGSEPAYCEQFPSLNYGCMRPDGSTALYGDNGPVSGSFFGQSSFATHAMAYERNVVKLAADADLVALAPLGCGVQTGVGGVLRSLAAKPGSSLLVIGAGAVGLSAVLGGKIAGCSPIIVIEPREERRTLARELGADLVINPTAGDSVKTVQMACPRGVDHVFDTSGNVGAIEVALEMLAVKGTLGLVGVPAALDAKLSISIVTMIMAGLTVKGIVEGDSVPDVFLPELVTLHEQGRLPYDRFTTVYAFDQINQAIADAEQGRCVKAVLVMP